MVLLPLVALVVAFSLGIPIAFSLAGAGILGIWLITGDWTVVMSVVGTTFFSTVAQHVLTTIPMFILMAYFASSAGLANDLYNGFSSLLSRLRGGIVIASVFTCTIFGAMCGTSLAAASVMGQICMPNLVRLGHSKTLAAGAIGVGSTISMLIPPSLAMVIYGVMTGTSIGKLLISGVVPGILLAIVLSVLIIIWITIRPSDAPRTQQVSWVDCWRKLSRLWPSIILILSFLGFLYTGFATPTEVGAIGAFMAGVIGFATGHLTWASAVKALKQTVRTTSMIFMILIGGSIFGYFIVMSEIPQKVIMTAIEMNLNRWVFLGAICVGYFVVSMFMDELPLIIITLQVTFPAIVSLGFDPIWFGVLTTFLVAIGLVFPPVGMVAFILSSATEVDLVTVYKGTSIMIIGLGVLVLMLVIFPQIALWLPSTMRG